MVLHISDDLLMGRLKKKKKKKKNTPAFRYRVLSEDSFDKPDIFPTTIASCSSGQKAGLTQSSSRSIT